MTTTHALRTAAILSILALAMAGCAQTGRSTAPSEAQAPAKPAATTGLNASGEVIDSSKVVAGSGQRVKGLNNYEGEITGKAGPRSQFNKLQIGMSMKQVVDLIGQPTDRGAYMTGKAWIPFYYGGDRHRFEFVYKNQGRLIFAGGSLGDFSGGNLTWIIHNANEGGYR